MGLQEVVPGRYEASVVDWGAREVEALDGAPEAWVSFEFRDQAGNPQSITWKSLFMTKAGLINKKTAKSLAACGFEGDNFITLLDETCSTTLDKTTPVDIEIVDNAVGDKIYKNVEWINKKGEKGGNQPVKLQGAEAQTLAQKMARMGLGRVITKPKPRNHAPGAAGSGPEPSNALTGPQTESPGYQDENDIPF